MNLHRLIEQGSLEQLREALRRGADVNAPGRIQQTPLMAAIAAGDLEKMKLLIDHGADPELTDEFNATALRHAVSCDFADGVQFLLTLGVDRGHHPKYPLKSINDDRNWPALDFPKELSEFMSEDEWKQSIESAHQSLSEAGQRPTVVPIISEVASLDVLRLFLEAGDDLSLAPGDMSRAYMGIDDDGSFQSTFEDYRKHKSPRYGTRNPERMDNPFWSDMIRLGVSAYSAKTHFHDTGPCQGSGPVWCNDRFGSSITQLADGRFVQVAGEHEDHYDPDFYIYNDVVVHDGQGGCQIYGYPKEVFPPTDFHTATLVGRSIYVIGCLGYPDQRALGRTPVYRLELESWRIETVPTFGEMPSWLHRHRARYEARQNAIRVEGGSHLVAGSTDNLELVPNDAEFELDLSSFQWRQVK